MKFKFLKSLNRNTFLFLAGMLGVAHETLLEHSERPTLLILFAAMMGLPAFLAGPTTEARLEDKEQLKRERDEQRQRQAEKDEELEEATKQSDALADAGPTSS